MLKEGKEPHGERMKVLDIRQKAQDWLEIALGKKAEEESFFPSKEQQKHRCKRGADFVGIFSGLESSTPLGLK